MFVCCTVLTPADPEFHIDKSRFTVPFVCGARDLGEALRRIAEGATMIRTKGEAGTGKLAFTSYYHNDFSSCQLWHNYPTHCTMKR